jgi:hypothetical protein
VLIGLYGDVLHVDPCRRGVLVIERFLCLDETADLFGDDARIGVPGLMQVQILKARSSRILLLGKPQSIAELISFPLSRFHLPTTPLALYADEGGSQLMSAQN